MDGDRIVVAAVTENVAPAAAIVSVPAVGTKIKPVAVDVAASDDTRNTAGNEVIVHGCARAVLTVDGLEEVFPVDGLEVNPAVA